MLERIQQPLQRRLPEERPKALRECPLWRQPALPGIDQSHHCGKRWFLADPASMITPSPALTKLVRIIPN